MESFLPLVQNNVASALWFQPELALTFGTLFLLVLDLFWKKSAARVAFLTVGALAVLGIAAALLAGQPQEATPLFSGMVANDAFANFFKWLFLAAGGLTVLIASQGKDFPPQRIGQFYALLVAIVLGMFLMASATDLLMIYLSGRAGTTSLLDLGPRILALQASGASLAATRIALVVSVVLVMSGIGYKVAAVPWHMWCPDVYEGAPTPFTAFLSVGPKAAGFALAL